MTREEFKAKVKGVVDSQTFGKFDKLFEYDDYNDMKIAYIPDDLMSCEADMPLDEFMDDLYEQIVKPLVTPIQRWIPVSERLPEKNIEVLATTEWGAVTIAEMYSANDWFIHEGTTNAETDDIVAWMPLPEPYKAEMENEK